MTTLLNTSSTFPCTFILHIPTALQTCSVMPIQNCTACRCQPLFFCSLVIHQPWQRRPAPSLEKFLKSPSHNLHCPQQHSRKLHIIHCMPNTIGDRFRITTKRCVVCPPLTFPQTKVTRKLHHSLYIHCCRPTLVTADTTALCYTVYAPNCSFTLRS